MPTPDAEGPLQAERAEDPLDPALHLDLRAVRHDYKIERLRTLFEHYASGAATSEHLGWECLLTIISQLADKSTGDLIAEFAIEPMRDYLASER